ncbi:unnamed protein product [Caenorhabditis angaria]|uniref:Saposin B-type domain-containing protein n=1 Tax=Caenorhabditis angaria TaxID=860376 RepID=A0A9P1IRH0_9PELO|nr:unnamed protein product [Caenorhabditis angaria]
MLKISAIFVISIGIVASLPFSATKLELDPKVQCAVCQFLATGNFSAKPCDARNGELSLFQSDVSSSTCTMCFLVYDTLKYINYNILDNPMLGEVKQAILSACGFLNQDLCEALFEVDTFGAIIQGLKDSLGGFYDAIAVQGFGCPGYNDLFTKC